MIISSCFHRGSCEMFNASIACSAYRNVDDVSVLEVYDPCACACACVSVRSSMTAPDRLKREMGEKRALGIMDCIDTRHPLARLQTIQPVRYTAHIPTRVQYSV